jgi:putative hydrolase of the HAD superfamily
MTSLQAVVFDLDDTLYPERQYVESGFRAVAEWAHQHLGIPSHAGYAGLVTLFSQGVRGQTFDCWLERHGIVSKDAVAQLVRVYRTHAPALRPFPEVTPLLTALRHRHRLGLLTDGYVSVQQRKLDALGLEPYFDAVVFSDVLGRERSAWKPSLIPFRTTLERLGVKATAAVYVGDNPLKDFVGARHCGLGTIRLRLAGGVYNAFEPKDSAQAPDYTVTSWTHLRLLLESWVGPRPESGTEARLQLKEC